VDVVALPECWNCPYSNAKFPEYAEEIPEAVSDGPSAAQLADSPSIQSLCSAAKDHGIWIVGGSVPERRGDSLFNTCVVVDPDGVIRSKYSKIHLFDIDIPGKMTFKESDSLTGGSALATVEIHGVRVGIAICYDIRFPELFLAYHKRHQVECMLIPGAFNTTTGPRHWELLQRARAVDNQVWVSAISPSRVPGASYQVPRFAACLSHLSPCVFLHLLPFFASFPSLLPY
jgi:omega-amidase